MSSGTLTPRTVTSNGARAMMRCALLTLASVCHAAIADPGDIVGDWHLDEGTGEIAQDCLGPGNDCELQGPTWVPGFAGSALQFGNYDAVMVANSETLEPQEITVELWVRGLAQGDYKYLVQKGLSGCYAASYAIYNVSGGLSFYIYTSNGVFWSTFATVGIWDGRWHHIAGTYDGQAVRLHVDGNEIGGATPASGPILYDLSPYNELYLGFGPSDLCGGASFTFNGDLDEVRIWNRALSTAEIAARAQETPVNECVVPCLSDLDSDGRVSATDLSDLLAAWGPNPDHQADLNDDGNVSIPDLLELLANWGPCP